MPTPFSISAFPVRGISIAQAARRCQEPSAIPFGCHGQPFKRLEGLQLPIADPIG